MKFQHVGTTMSEELSMSKSSKDSLDKFSKGHCFSMVHVGVNKCLSNQTIIESYEKAIEGTFNIFFSYAFKLLFTLSYNLLEILQRAICFSIWLKI